MIWKNFFRELIIITSRLTSVIIITIVAVMVFVGLNGIDYNGNKIVKSYFETQNTADYWVTGIKFNEDDYNEIKQIEGISEIDKRIALEGNEVHNKEIKLAVYGLSNEYTMNKPYIVDGTLPKNETQAMISSEFAKEQGLNIGDKYSINIPGYPSALTFEISALIKNPERMYNISKTIPSPDYSKYGFIYVDEETINSILGENIYNQLCIKVKDDADVEYIENEIIEKIDSKIINITQLKDNVNAYNLLDFINGIEPIIKGLPLIFFVIAALLMVSTMSRLIENSRLAIGTLKALGYNDFIIMLYYLLYSVIVVVMGFAIGAFLSINIITKPISDILFRLNDLPAYLIEYDKNALLQAFILTVITTVGTAIIITRNALKEKPSQCMGPKAPKKERRLLIEKITPIWSKMSFSKKYIIKNTFRNRSRLFTCIVGIAACMALILTCLSLKDSINNFTDKIVNNEHKYDIYLTLNNNINDLNIDKINNMKMVEETEYLMVTEALLSNGEKTESSYVNITEDKVSLKLLSTYGDATNYLPLDGIIIEDKLAEEFNLSIGDFIDIKLSGREDFATVEIAEINKDIKGIYLSKTYLNEIGEKFSPNSVYVKTNNIDSFKGEIADYDFVKDYEIKDTITDAIVNKISVLSLVVYILILLGGILALVVLYNLGIMSFYEQIRSLATLMVLGFYTKEIKKLQLTENIIFTVIGIATGIPLGIGLTKVITGALTLANLQPATTLMSYTISGAITIVFATIVNIIIGKMFKNIDMLGALKSVE